MESVFLLLLAAFAVLIILIQRAWRRGPDRPFEAERRVKEQQLDRIEQLMHRELASAKPQASVPWLTLGLYGAPLLMLGLAIAETPWAYATARRTWYYSELPELPYGFFMLLRVVVFSAAAAIAALIWQESRQLSPWVLAFGICALLYNPFAPAHLTREVWLVVNLAAVVLFVARWKGASRP